MSSTLTEVRLFLPKLIIPAICIESADFTDVCQNNPSCLLNNTYVYSSTLTVDACVATWTLNVK